MTLWATPSADPRLSPKRRALGTLYLNAVGEAARVCLVAAWISLAMPDGVRSSCRPSLAS
jgi:hypothetical protein